MRHFRDTATSLVWAFEDDVKVTETAGVWSFVTARGAPLSQTPKTLVPCDAPVPPAPTLAQKAMAALAPKGADAGMVVTAPANAALDGTYAIDPVSIAKMISICSAWTAGLGLPSAGETFNYSDIPGAMHAWPAMEFLALARAAIHLAYELEMVAAGSADVLPSVAVSIT